MFALNALILILLIKCNKNPLLIYLYSMYNYVHTVFVRLKQHLRIRCPLYSLLENIITLLQYINIFIDTYIFLI